MENYEFKTRQKMGNRLCEYILSKTNHYYLSCSTCDVLMIQMVYRTCDMTICLLRSDEHFLMSFKLLKSALVTKWFPKIPERFWGDNSGNPKNYLPWINFKSFKYSLKCNYSICRLIGRIHALDAPRLWHRILKKKKWTHDNQKNQNYKLTFI